MKANLDAWARLMAIVAEGEHGRVYLPPTAAMDAVARQAKPEWKPDVEFFQQALGFRVGNYGMTRWSDLFTPRQLVALTTFSDLVYQACERAKRDALAAGLPGTGARIDSGGEDATAYVDALAVYSSRRRESYGQLLGNSVRLEFTPQG